MSGCISCTAFVFFYHKFRLLLSLSCRTFMTLKKPSIFFRALVLGAQGILDSLLNTGCTDAFLMILFLRTRGLLQHVLYVSSFALLGMLAKNNFNHSSFILPNLASHVSSFCWLSRGGGCVNIVKTILSLLGFMSLTDLSQHAVYPRDGARASTRMVGISVSAFRHLNETPHSGQMPLRRRLPKITGASVLMRRCWK